jgi:hypothetical protein
MEVAEPWGWQGRGIMQFDGLGGDGSSPPNGEHYQFIMHVLRSMH